MRIRTPRASVWVDDVTKTLSPASAPVAALPATPPALRAPAQVRWASRPYQGRLGRCVAVRLRGDVLDVAVVQQDNSLRWVRASLAMTTAEARAWLAEGFAT